MLVQLLEWTPASERFFDFFLVQPSRARSMYFEERRKHRQLPHGAAAGCQPTSIGLWGMTMNGWNFSGRLLGVVVLVGSLGFSSSGCDALGLTSEDDDNTLTLALAAYVATNKFLDASTGCIYGVATTLDTALPSWIKDNFKCQTVTVSGSNYVFRTLNYPNYKSYYWGSTSPLYEALPSGNTAAGSNLITAQSLTITIPSVPNTSGSTTATGAQGVATNGVVIYNNAANAPDTLASEATTFDNYGGHPQNAGQYHYHAEPGSLSSSDSNLIGIALDGYAVYGLVHKSNSGATNTPTPGGTGADNTTLEGQLHGHTATTQHFATGTYHYHLAQDSTATIKTLIGSNFKGTQGSVAQ